MTLLVRHTPLRRIYNARVAESRRERLTQASIGFFTAVLVVRGITVAIHYNFGPFHDVSMGGRHIHHLVWGILLLLLSGYGWLLQVGTGAQDSLQWVGRLMSMIYGVAAALTLDEFALWLNLRDVYWQRRRKGELRGHGAFRRIAGDRGVRAEVFPGNHGIVKRPRNAAIAACPPWGNFVTIRGRDAYLRIPLPPVRQ